MEQKKIKQIIRLIFRIKFNKLLFNTIFKYKKQNINIIINIRENCLRGEKSAQEENKLKRRTHKKNKLTLK